MLLGDSKAETEVSTTTNGYASYKYKWCVLPEDDPKSVE